jgi:hypothetical protein
MPTPPLPEDEVRRTIEAYKAADRNVSLTARVLGKDRATVQSRIRKFAAQGLLGYAPVMPGFAVKSVSSKSADGAWVKQTREPGEVFAPLPGHVVKGESALVDPDGRITAKWVKTDREATAALDALKAAADAFKADIPRAEPVTPPEQVVADLLNQFTITDNHFGMLAWREETGADYDLKIAEQLLVDWFAAAIEASPRAHTALFANLGDLMHHDALESVTPAHGHVLDADSRLQKVIRVIIRVIRRVIAMLLARHEHVRVVMAAGNHDPASSAWLREMLAAFYENEPRLTVDQSPRLYYAYEWGRTALFYHHGHKRGVSDVDAVFASMFREMFGRCSAAYAHVGHRHSNEGVKTRLMYVEQHETLAAKDAFNAGGGWPGGRSAKVITYSKQGGEVFRSTLRPEMVAGKAKEAA